MTMRDQADELRQMIQRGSPASWSRRTSGERSPKLVTVTGGKGGVGATTLAVNLALSLAGEGHRTVLVDADLDSADAAALCHIDASFSVADVLAGRRTVHETLQRGPMGLLVLPGAWALGSVADCSPAAQERLIEQLKGLGAYADFVILDTGNGLNRAMRRFWQAADHVLLVTSSEAVSVMDAYAAVKVLANGWEARQIHSIVSQAIDASSAEEVHERLARACRRFLGLRISAWGQVAFDPRVAQSSGNLRPFLLDHPSCQAAQDIQQIAQALQNSEAELAATGADVWSTRVKAA
jgi:flagellar biosynthesis protein FlhG